MNNIKLSKETISTFCADIVTLQLKSDTDLRNAHIKWQSSDDKVVSIREFCEGKSTTNLHDGDYYAFNDGVLLTMTGVGEAKVTATLDGVTYSCDVSVREAETANPTDKFNFYFNRFPNITRKIVRSL